MRNNIKKLSLIFCFIFTIMFLSAWSKVGNVNVMAANFNNLKVHYIDVGQGDSELIQCGGKNMLIDTGTNESTSNLMSYLKNQNVQKIDYLVLTHPHEDHIGGADEVINNFNIGTIYMPNVATNTQTYKDVIQAMRNKGLTATNPVVGSTFKVGSANCIVYGPINTNSENLNTYSIVIKLTYGNNKFMFTGDAQSSNEQDMINAGFDLSADVLKVGHHGSHTSSSQDFLNAVNPKYAVISCGLGNDYGHPHKVTMDKLEAMNIPVYRTDENGTIVCTSDGNNISFNCEPGDYKDGSELAGGESYSYMKIDMRKLLSFSINK
ncbi:competence protein ComEC [Clostridium acetobutylicum]|uniref:ComEC/Rec2 family competence protein n=1 Tax=Clostridium TaxID=1485 RepID=UPI000200A6CF|nr:MULTISPECIES: ComEC/Rec2 family competence protein [Clostridium]ADZ19997.1 ComE-like protein, Metallo beta-lactamase superfamily hydrolase, secreted [Clostridium acetobutylicum EA 2018]AEI34699.1 ComE-like protein [Clostridium acetobutylicum DSM 1731]AWV80641.1 MBL fold metallo-hydrolase [Clostridium acetobutylicum]MBC2392831.1 MBL fold metallo-hydrolase [Clostridium acetobutylicum]MBC2584659.1 MBL fold metallo-hydrolase [Clostridium acetobutylicum]